MGRDVLPPDRGVLLVIDRPDDLWAVTWELLRIGYETPAGWLAGGMRAWRREARPLRALPQTSVHELREQLEREAVDVLDVRQPAEWAAGHIPQAMLITGAGLPEREAAGYPTV